MNRGTVLAPSAFRTGCLIRDASSGPKRHCWTAGTAVGSWLALKPYTQSSGAPRTKSRSPGTSAIVFSRRLLNQTERIRTYIAEELRAGLSIEEAGERYCVLASPDVYHPMTVDLGWSAEYHQAWLTQLIRAELLGTDYWARTQTPTADGSSVPETTEAQSAASRSAST